MRRYLPRAVGIILLVAAAVYVVDFSWLQFRIARNLNPYDSVRVQRVYIIPQKGNKAEYVPADPEQQPCVRSLFPHAGNQPCWYLRRNKVQQMNM